MVKVFPLPNPDILDLPDLQNPFDSTMVQALKEAAKRLLSRPVRKKDPISPRNEQNTYIPPNQHTCGSSSTATKRTKEDQHVQRRCLCPYLEMRHTHTTSGGSKMSKCTQSRSNEPPIINGIKPLSHKFIVPVGFQPPLF